MNKTLLGLNGLYGRLGFDSHYGFGSASLSDYADKKNLSISIPQNLAEMSNIIQTKMSI